jgi:fucose permease
MPETIPPPTARRRFFRTSLGLLVLTYLGFVSLGLPDGAFGVAWPTLRPDFGLTQAAFGAVLLATAIGFLGSSLFAGPIIGRIGAGRLLSGSTLIVGLGLALASASPTYPVLLLAALIAGFGGGAIDSGLNGYAAARYSARQMNWLHAAFGLGAAVGPALMTFAVRTADWRFGYVLIAAAMLAMACLFFFTRHGFAEQVSAEEPVRVARFREVIGHGIVWLQVLTFLVYVGVEITAGQWAYAVLRSRGYEIEPAGAFTTAFWIALFAGRLLLGFGADRIGPERLIRLGALGAFAGGVLFLFDPLGLGPLGLVLIGFSVAPIYPMLMHRTPKVLGPSIAPGAIGLQVSAAMVGGVLLPSVAGFAAEAFGLVAPLVVLVASALILLALVEATLRLGPVPRA